MKKDPARDPEDLPAEAPEPEAPAAMGAKSGEGESASSSSEGAKSGGESSASSSSEGAKSGGESSAASSSSEGAKSGGESSAASSSEGAASEGVKSGEESSATSSSEGVKSGEESSATSASEGVKSGEGSSASSTNSETVASPGATAPHARELAEHDAEAALASGSEDGASAKAGKDGASAKGNEGGAKAGAEIEDPKKDPIRFFVSLLVLLAALGAGEAAYRRSTLPAAVFVTETYPVKMQDYAKKGGADVVIVGSSRIYHGANAPLLSRLASEGVGKPVTVYNMGIPSGDVPGYVLTANDVLRPSLKRPTLFVFAMSPIEWMCCPATSVPSSPRWVTSVRMRHAWGLVSSATDPEEAFTDLTIGLFQSYGSRTHVINQIVHDKPPPSWRGNAGQDGWVSFGWGVDAVTQDIRANGRAAGYAPYFFPPMHFDRGATHRYFQKAMGWLESSGVKVAIVGTAQARQLDKNHVPPSYYPEYVEYLTEQARLHGTEFVNFNAFPGLENIDFADGDHLSEPGSVKFSRLLSEHVIVPMLRGQKPIPL